MAKFLIRNGNRVEALHTTKLIIKRFYYLRQSSKTTQSSSDPKINLKFVESLKKPCISKVEEKTVSFIT